MNESAQEIIAVGISIMLVFIGGSLFYYIASKCDKEDKNG